jgi:hypothetical protein
MRRYAPAFVLIMLSTFIGEVLFGATTLSRIGGLLVVTPLYGGGALLIRELARRRGPGWLRIGLLGAAYAIVEEGLALQSMFNPNLFNAGLLGGQALGVNWVWVQWTIGYHVVWSISIPILLTELLFPERRAGPWLGRAGVIVAGVVYAAGALALGAITRLAIAPDFHTPMFLDILAALVAAGLVALALGWPAKLGAAAPAGTARPAPSPWLMALIAGGAACAWFVLLDIPHVLRDSALVILPMLLELSIAALLAWSIRRWSAPGRAWTELHQLALACGALVVSALVGFFFVTAGNPIDQLGVGLSAAITSILTALFIRRLRQRGQGSPQPRRQVANTLP